MESAGKITCGSAVQARGNLNNSCDQPPSESIGIVKVVAGQSLNTLNFYDRIVVARHDCIVCH